MSYHCMEYHTTIGEDYIPVGNPAIQQATSHPLNARQGTKLLRVWEPSTWFPWRLSNRYESKDFRDSGTCILKYWTCKNMIYILYYSIILFMHQIVASVF